MFFTFNFFFLFHFFLFSLLFLFAIDNHGNLFQVRSISAQLERVFEEKSLIQSDLSVKTSEITLLKTNEKRLVRDFTESRERSKSLEEELQKVRNNGIHSNILRGAEFFFRVLFAELGKINDFREEKN